MIGTLFFLLGVVLAGWMDGALDAATSVVVAGAANDTGEGVAVSVRRKKAIPAIRPVSATRFKNICRRGFILSEYTGNRAREQVL